MGKDDEPSVNFSFSTSTLTHVKKKKVVVVRCEQVIFSHCADSSLRIIQGADRRR